MSTLYVRNVPEDLYEALKRRAAQRNSSISAETIRLLRQAMRVDHSGVRELLEEIERHRPEPSGPPLSAAELLGDGLESGGAGGGDGP
jgi:plasmid stability protein